MQKRLKLTSAALACLLTVAPLAAPIIAQASAVAVTPGTNDDLEEHNIKVSFVVKNPYSLTDGENVTNVQTDLSSSVGTAVLLSNANVYIVKASDKVTDADSAKAAAVKNLKAGGQYIAVITDAAIKNLNNNQDYNLAIGGADSKAVKSNDFGIIPSLGLIKSNTFTVPDKSIAGTPYFTKHKSDKVITKTTLDLGVNNVNNMIKLIKNNVDYHGGDSKNTAYDSDLLTDLTSQLQAQNIKVNADGSFKPTAATVSVNYIVHFVNGKTGTLPVTFKVDPKAVDPESPVISINDTDKVKGADGSFTYNDLDFNSNVTAQDIAKAFKAKASKDDDTAVDVTVSSSNLNTAIPGTYTVVLSAKNKVGKITTATVSVTVKAKATVDANSNSNGNANSGANNTVQATNMTVQYEDGESVPVYKVKDNKAVKSGLELKNGSIVATFGTQIVGDTSYQKIINDSGSMLVPTKYLDGSYVKAKRLSRKVMHAAWIYTAAGKRKNKTVIHAYSTVTTLGAVTKIGKINFYKVGQNEYIKAGNLDGTKRKLTKKAYVYNGNGRIIKTKKGARYAVKKGKVITTYGAHFKIGKTNYYRVGKGQYIPMSDFGKAVATKTPKKAVDTKAVTAGSAKNNALATSDKSSK